MDLRQLIAKAIGERTLNSAAKEWGLPQATLHAYSIGKNVPGYQAAVIIADAAGITLDETMRICARTEAQLKPRASFVKKFLTTASDAANEAGQKTGARLYLMSNALRQLFRRATDATALAPPSPKTR